MEKLIVKLEDIVIKKDAGCKDCIFSNNMDLCNVFADEEHDTHKQFESEAGDENCYDGDYVFQLKDESIEFRNKRVEIENL